MCQAIYKTGRITGLQLDFHCRWHFNPKMAFSLFVMAEGC